MPELVIAKPVAYSAFAAQNPKLGPAPAPGKQAGIGARSAGAAAGAGAPMASPPALFKANSNSAADVQYQRAQHQYYTGLIDSLLAAVSFAHGLWKLQAFFSDIKINGPSASGGKLNGPNLMPFIMSAPKVTGLSGKDASVRNAVAKGVGESFAQWQKNVTVPGLPWYPAFAAFPGPAAPPVANVPTPLLACISPSVADIITPGPMKDRMRGNLQGSFDFASELFHAIASALAVAFNMWLAAQTVQNVMGRGPIPAFAPPYVPVGPVVGGDVLPAPGHLIQ